MARPLVASARIDENGRSYGGAAGDQNGKEVSTQKWYKHAKGWDVLRFVNRQSARRAVYAMQCACDNANIGYDQHQRDTLLRQAEKHEYDIGKVDEPCETDCSALIRVCLAYACEYDVVGRTTSERFSTRNLVKVLLATGRFVQLTGSKYTEHYEYLGEGDILCTKTQGHVVMVMGNGSKYEGVVEAKEYALGDRIIRMDDVGADVRVMQEYLLALGYDVGKYGTDGEYGEDTRRALLGFQTDHGLEPDGEYGEQTHAALMAAVERFQDVPVIQPGEGGQLVVLDDDNWNVRTGPGTAYAKVGMLRPGDTVQELNTEGWKVVRFNGEARFVNEGAFVAEGG